MINTIKKSANKNYTDVTEKWINASLKKGKVKIAQCYIYNNIKYVVDGKYIILDYTHKEMMFHFGVAFTEGQPFTAFKRSVMTIWVAPREFSPGPNNL